MKQLFITVKKPKVPIVCLLMMFFALIFSSCGTENSMGEMATINLHVEDCFTKSEIKTRLCLDSVYNDSRCHKGYECVWEGDALAAFTLIQNGVKTHFDLHANQKFKTDTVINGTSIKLIAIAPYPVARESINPKDYSVDIIFNKP